MSLLDNRGNEERDKATITKVEEEVEKYSKIRERKQFLLVRLSSSFVDKYSNILFKIFGSKLR